MDVSEIGLEALARKMAQRDERFLMARTAHAHITLDLSIAAGKKLGDPLGISEDTWTANGIYPALRTQMPWAFGPDTSLAAGDLEYYARVTASFRLQ